MSQGIHILIKVFYFLYHLQLFLENFYVLRGMPTVVIHKSSKRFVFRGITQ